jgi:tripartite-type tricarboxylate transporter receptor subunit TctC
MSSIRIRRFTRRSFCLSLALIASAAACAEPPWPGKPIRLIVAYAPGGLSDDTARSIARLLSQQIGVPVLVENKPGAGGVIAMEALSRAPADGHTLCLSAITPLALSRWLVRLNFDPMRDITPVASVMYTPVMIVGTPAFRGQHFADLLAAARAQPGALRWATSGNGTLGHLVLQQVSLHSGVRVTHVPYGGGGPQLNDALSGQFELLSTNVAPLQLRYVARGTLKPLAVGAPSRLPVLPQVPTLAELGIPEANLASLFGLFAPGGMAPARLSQVHAALQRVLQSAEIRERLLAANNVPVDGSPEDFARLIARQSDEMHRLVQSDAALR